jgi:hypothetical protein
VTTPGSWELVSRTDWTPTGAVSALVALANHKTGSGDFQTHHDCVFFGPNPTMVFADDFESLDVGQWSSAVGSLWLGSYDACTGPTCGPLQDCLDTLVAGALPFCSPQCLGVGSSCPGRQGVAGVCALGQGPDPTNCGLICDPVDPRCPSGMTCFDVGTGGLCLWPVR